MRIGGTNKNENFLLFRAFYLGWIWNIDLTPQSFHIRRVTLDISHMCTARNSIIKPKPRLPLAFLCSIFFHTRRQDNCSIVCNIRSKIRPSTAQFNPHGNNICVLKIYSKYKGITFGRCPSFFYRFKMYFICLQSDPEVPPWCSVHFSETTPQRKIVYHLFSWNYQHLSTTVRLLPYSRL